MNALRLISTPALTQVSYRSRWSMSSSNMLTRAAMTQQQQILVSRADRFTAGNHS